MFAIKTKYHFATSRISASDGEAGCRIYVDANDEPADEPGYMTMDAQRHHYAAQQFIERKMSVDPSRRKLIGGWLEHDAMVWVFADSYDRTPGA